MNRALGVPPIEVVDDDVVEMLRGKTPAECVAMMGEANEMARLLAAAGIRYLHPDWSPDQVSARSGQEDAR